MTQSNYNNIAYFAQERREMLKYIPLQSKTILDIGCGEGLFGGIVKKRNLSEVWGVELDANIGKKACNILDKVIIGNILNIAPEIPNNYFDCIVLNDILEHLVDPYSLLVELKNKINQNGIIVCSIPNIRYFHVLKELILEKQFRYKDLGVLDRTHLRFFTYESIKEMFKNLHYEIIIIEGINPIISWKFDLFNILTFNYMNDTRFAQFAITIKPA